MLIVLQASVEQEFPQIWTDVCQVKSRQVPHTHCHNRSRAKVRYVP